MGEYSGEQSWSTLRRQYREGRKVTNTRYPDLRRGELRQGHCKRLAMCNFGHGIPWSTSVISKFFSILTAVILWQGNQGQMSGINRYETV